MSTFKIDTASTRNLLVNNENREIDISKFPAHVIDFILDYGTRQILNDAHASALDNAYPESVDQKTYKKMTRAEQVEYLDAKKAWGKANPDSVNAERESMIEAKLERLEAGELRATSGQASMSPFESMCYSVAREWIKAAIKAQGGEIKDFTGLDKDEQHDVLTGFIDTNRDAIETEAQSRLDAKTKAAAIKIDIAGLVKK